MMSSIEWKTLLKDGRKRTILLANLAGILDAADGSLLPSVYREIGLQMRISPTTLGTLSLFRAMTQTLCFPVAAFFSSHCNRTHVIAVGALMWAIPTIGMGISSTFLELAIWNGITGAGLALVVPAIQSLVADSTDNSSRGVAFGWLQLSGIMGSMIGGFSSVLLASTTVLGVSGWRISFFVVGFISVAVGLFFFLVAVDPSFNTRQQKLSWERKHVKRTTFSLFLKESMMDAQRVVGIPTFQVIIAQGMVGTFSGASLAFLAMWLELIGYTHKKTAVLLSIFSISCALGGLIGGRLGDMLSTHLPNAGRIMLAQLGTSAGPPLAAMLFLLSSNDTSKWLQRAMVFWLLGSLTSWNATATNNPIFAEIVPVSSRTMAYALDRSFESLLAAFAPTMVGLLAERVYGYVPFQKNKDDQRNGFALGRALCTAYSIPYALCCLIYSFLYYTYPKDRDKAREMSQYMASMYDDEQDSPSLKMMNDTISTTQEMINIGKLESEQLLVET